METLSDISYILMVIVGLGFVIFIHELGHFLMAKRNDVKVETFSIGFGPALFGFRRGETRYIIAALPLGGYVRMLGEEQSADGERPTDPRAYNNKSPGARMAIISAGVIMNVLLGLACFVFAYKWGMPYTPAVVGAVAPGSPAYEAGVLPGDRVAAADGRGELTFSDVALAAAYTAKGEAVHLDVERPGVAGTVGVDVRPRRERGSVIPTMGIGPASDPIISEVQAELPGRDKAPDFREGDRIVALGPAGGRREPVATYPDLQRLLARHRGRPLEAEVERGGKAGESQAQGKSTAVVAVPPNQFVGLGLRMAIGPVGAVRRGSPADKAGFRKGDRIVAVDGKADFDPMRLPFLVFDRAGEPVEFRVRRESRGGAETLTLTARPDASPPWSPIDASGLLDVPGLGLAYGVDPKVVAVEPGSPAAEAGIKPGAVLKAITLPKPRGKDKGKDKDKKAQDLKLAVGTTDDDEATNWVLPFKALQQLPRQEVRLTIAGRAEPVALTPRREPGWYSPTLGVALTQMTRPLPPQSVPAAIRRGLLKTRESIVQVFLTIRGFAQGQVGRKGLAGPIRIFTAGKEIASEGLAPFVQFLGLLSINLAVLNFLPIPPLDGGQFVFLAIEKLRGRPLPDSAQVVGQAVGVVLVLSLMVFALSQDIWLTWIQPG